MMSLVLSGVSQAYGKTKVIDSLDLTLNSGVVGLLGPNGSGKTTLMRTMATVMPPMEGTVALDDVIVNDERTARQARESIGYLPQSFGFHPRMRVADFVCYAAWMRGIPSGEWDDVVERALREVDLWEQRRSRMRTLSGGMRQRAGIAWAIAGEPPLILLDEPTVGLDPRQRLHFRKIIRRRSRSVVVLSTHLIDDIDATCDSVVVLQEGRPRFVGTVAEMAALGDGSGMPGNTAMERAYMFLLPVFEQQL